MQPEYKHFKGYKEKSYATGAEKNSKAVNFLSMQREN
jgi:hypothetical protein